MEHAATLMERVLYEVKKTVVGQDHFLERVLVAMLAGGHLLVEGVPGLAKTLTVKTLAAAPAIRRGPLRRSPTAPAPCATQTAAAGRAPVWRTPQASPA